MPSNLMIVTQVGLNAAVSAIDTGIKVKLATFALGAAYNYQATKDDTALHGTVVYSDAITNFTKNSDGTLVAICTISPEAGPFSFGEIGIYTDTGELFCILAFPKLYDKETSLGTNIATTFTFQCGMRLGQSVAVIEISSSAGTITSIIGTDLDIGPGKFRIDHEGRVTMVEGQVPTNYAWRMEDSSYFNSMPSKAVVVNYDNGAPSSSALPSFAVGNGVGGTSMTVSYAGDLSANTVTGNVVTQLSDRRFKKDLVRIDNAMDLIASLTGYRYTRVDNSSREIGLVAQEAEVMVPEVVHRRDGGTLSLMYGNLAALFVEALKEKDQQIHTLKDAFTDIESRLLKLENSNGN